jgi:hypothetical protein
MLSDVIDHDDVTVRARQRGLDVPEGVSITVRLFADPDIHPATDGDWASPRDIELWKEDGWRYVALEVTVSAHVKSGDYYDQDVELARDFVGAFQSGAGDGWEADPMTDEYPLWGEAGMVAALLDDARAHARALGEMFGESES